MKSKFIWIMGCGIFLIAAASVVAEEPRKDAVAAAVQKAAGDAPKAAPAKGTPVALTLEAIQELEDRKTALDARERQLAERAKALDVQEKILQDKLRKMEDLNRRMAEKLDGFKKEHEDKVAKLVTVVETMKPAAAAEYVENLDSDLAVAILARMQVARAAKIMNLVDKKKSARLTELYTGYRSGEPVKEEVPAPRAPASATAPVKEETPAAKK